MSDVKLILAEKMREAFMALDKELDFAVTLIVGGGCAMILAHGFPLGTYDIDAIPVNLNFAAIDPFVKKVATRLDLAGDWLNPWFSSFTHTLPSDYKERLIEIFKGSHLRALALGSNEMLIMKCFAARPKDVSHARALIKKGAKIDFVRKHLEKLADKNIPGADRALDFLDDIQDQIL